MSSIKKLKDLIVNQVGIVGKVNTLKYILVGNE